MTLFPEIPELSENIPRIFNHHKKNAPFDAVYIGRGSKYGNPFSIDANNTREEVIKEYREWIQNQPELLADIKKNLPGKDLVCYCFPQPCHGDVILEIANS